jgi:hypothetical protein
VMTGRIARQGDDAGRCVGCDRRTPDLYASGLCVGCSDAALEVIAGALEDSETPLTRAELTIALVAEWPDLGDPATVAGYVLARLVDDEEAKEISPGRYRLVLDDEDDDDQAAGGP